MKKTTDIKLLENLMKIPSPSGFEERLAFYIREQLLKLRTKKIKVEKDFQHNIIVTIPGENPDKKVMIDTHLDTIGFIVTNIDREGIISIQYIGGGDKSILTTRELVILTKNGPVNAVVDRKHAHLVYDEDDETIVDISSAQIDIGIRKRKQVAKIVRIGDPVVYKPNFQHLLGDYYSGYGFDDKSGCYILMRVIKEIVRSKRRPPVTLVFTFSAQEETGLSKSRPLARKYRPNLFVEVDVTFATDYGYGEDVMESIARLNKIKTQFQASTGMTGYTATETTNLGTRGLIVGIPLRNMHAPTEIINVRDLEGGVSLLTKFLLSKRIRNAIAR